MLGRRISASPSRQSWSIRSGKWHATAAIGGSGTGGLAYGSISAARSASNSRIGTTSSAATRTDCPLGCGPASAQYGTIAATPGWVSAQHRTHDRDLGAVVVGFGDGLPSALCVEVLGCAGVQVQAAVCEQ